MSKFRNDDLPMLVGTKAEPTCYTGEAINGVRDIIDAPDFLVAGSCRRYESPTVVFVHQTIVMREQ